MGSNASDAEIRLAVFRHFVDHGRAPSKVELAAQWSLPIDAITGAFERLSAGKALVLQPLSGELLMAEPFSAVPTSFEIESQGRRWYGNCIWDALGVPAALGQDARVRTSCPDCSEAMELVVRDGELESTAGVVHYVVPAHQWWQDVTFT